MPILLTILGAVTAIGIWIWRARNAADTAHEILDAANDIRLAARRFGFRRNHNRHPVEDIDDPSIAVAGIAVCFLELDDYPTQEERGAMLRGLQAEYRLNASDAGELSVLGRWMMTQCGGAQQGIDRMARKLYKLDKAQSFTPLMAVLKTMLNEAEGPMNNKQKSALEDIQTAFRIT